MTTRKGAPDLGNNGPFKKPKLQAAAMWDDSDDDDLILLASQAVEAVEAEQNHEKPPSTFNSFVSDMEKDTKTTTSTQRGVESQAQPAERLSVNVALRAKVTSSMALKQDKASQDFLRKRIEGLERDIHKSKEDCDAAQEKFQVKDYEVSSLKYELKELQKANSDLRLKLVKNEQYNKEIERNKAMERQLQKAEADLELKKLELLKLKSDRRTSSQMPQQQPIDVTITHPKADPPELNSFHLDVLVSRYNLTRADSWQIRLAHRIFENVTADVGMGTSVFVEQLSHLQRSMGLILQGHSMDVGEFVAHALEAMQLALNSISKKYDSSMQMMVGVKHRSRRNILSDYDQDRVGVCIYDNG